MPFDHTIRTIPLEHEECEKCHRVGFIKMFIDVRVEFVFFIPFMPGKRSGRALCTACGYTYYPWMMPEPMKTEYDKAQKASKAPKWTYTGLFFLACILLTGSYIIVSDSIGNKEYIVAPQVGDMYICERDDKQYAMKVVLLKKDSLVLHYTRYVPRSERKTIEIYDFRKASFDRSVTLARTTVLKMFESDEIRDVVRKDKAPPEDVPDQLE